MTDLKEELKPYIKNAFQTNLKRLQIPEQILPYLPITRKEDMILHNLIYQEEFLNSIKHIHAGLWHSACCDAVYDAMLAFSGKNTMRELYLHLNGESTGKPSLTVLAEADPLTHEILYFRLPNARIPAAWLPYFAPVGEIRIHNKIMEQTYVINSASFQSLAKISDPKPGETAYWYQTDISDEKNPKYQISLIFLNKKEMLLQKYSSYEQALQVAQGISGAVNDKILCMPSSQKIREVRLSYRNEDGYYIPTSF